MVSRNCAQCSLRQEKQEVDVRHTPAQRKVSRSSLEVSCGSTHFTPPFAAAGRSFDPEPLPASTDPGAGSADLRRSGPRFAGPFHVKGRRPQRRRSDALLTYLLPPLIWADFEKAGSEDRRLCGGTRGQTERYTGLFCRFYISPRPVLSFSPGGDVG
jgi:hypothetical protein